MGLISDRAGVRLLSPARRIRRQAPVKDHRACALLFDESPCAASDVTAALLDALRKASAKATFAVYGSTEALYPDRCGKREKESGRGVRYAHLPDWQKDTQGGARHCPELIRQIQADGHAIAVSNDTFQPNGRPWFSRRKAFQTAEESYQSIQQLMSAEALAGAAISAHLPPFDAAMLPDGRTVYDVCNALGMNCLSPAVSYASNFYRENDGKAEAERIVRSVQARLHDDSGWFDGKVIRMDGGLAPTLPDPAVPLAISRVLRLLQAAGYELLTVDELVARSPFADLDASAESFEAACDLLKRGYTVGCLGGTFRPDAEMQRDALYAMMVPPHIMQDYMISRLMKTEPAYGVNRRYEKEFLMAPGSPASAGMFYAYEAGWPLGKRQAVVTARDFIAFLDRVSAGKTLDWTPPKERALLKSDIIMALDQLIRAEQAEYDEQEQKTVSE